MNISRSIRRHPVATYFALVLLISYGGFLTVVGPRLFRGGMEQVADAQFVLFPVLVGGVLLVSIFLTATLDGKRGLQNLASCLVQFQRTW